MPSIAQAKKLLAKKKAAAASKKASASASLAAKEAKERALKKSKLKDKKNYNQVGYGSPGANSICMTIALFSEI